MIVVLYPSPYHIRIVAPVRVVVVNGLLVCELLMHSWTAMGVMCCTSAREPPCCNTVVKIKILQMHPDPHKKTILAYIYILHICRLLRISTGDTLMDRLWAPLRLLVLP